MFLLLSGGILALILYYYAYPFWTAVGLRSGMTDSLMLDVHRSGVFRSQLSVKFVCLFFTTLSVVVRSGSSKQSSWLEILLPLLAGNSDENAAEPDSKIRGLLTMLILRQYRRRSSDEAALLIDRYSSGDSSVLHAWLSSHSSDCVWILSLGREDEYLPFALVLPGLDLIPAKFSAAHTAFLPAFAAPWFDPECLSFKDPCTLLGEGTHLRFIVDKERFMSKLE